MFPSRKGTGRQGRGAPTPTLAPVHPPLPTRCLERGPCGPRAEASPEECGDRWPGSLRLEPHTGLGFEKLCVGRQGDPETPGGGRQPHKRRGLGPPTLQPLQQGCGEVGGGCLGRPRGPHSTVLREVGWPGPASSMAVSPAHGGVRRGPAPSLPTSSTSGRGRARRRRPDEARGSGAGDTQPGWAAGT